MGCRHQRSAEAVERRRARKIAGALTGKLPEMQHRADLYDLIDYGGYNRFGTGVFDFHLAR